MRRFEAVHALIILSAAACGGPSDGEDAGSRDGGDRIDAPAAVCARQADCEDALYCTIHRCEPGTPGADARGCVLEGSPCPVGQSCDEGAGECIAETCAADPDRDGDGHDSIACRGDDCDDDDPARYAGNPEVCDAEGHDEDCRADTLAGESDGDRDGDGFISDRCCQIAGSDVVCGTDCDDTSDAVRPSAAEICNGVDDNCNGMLDEGVLGTVYRDADMDNYGDPASAMPACFDAVPSGYVINSTDCADSDTSRHPGATERCNSVDDDCDGSTDESSANPDIGTLDHCTTCGDGCQFSCLGSTMGCDPPVELAAGSNHTCARTASFAVWCWGSNSVGELGVGASPTSSPRPLRVGALSAQRIWASAYGGSMCSTWAGRMSCWGDNAFGQLGLGHTSPVRTPAMVDASFGAGRQSALGAWHMCAHGAGSNVHCVGNNSRRQFNVTSPSSSTSWIFSGYASPAGVAIRYLVAGEHHSCVLRSDGRVACWGSNRDGELAASFFGDLGAQTLPTVTGVDQLVGGTAHMCARSGSAIQCWGRNDRGQVGDGVAAHGNTCNSSDCVRAPAAIVGVPSAAALFAGGSTTCATTTTGTLYCWGRNAVGRSSVNTPTAVPGVADAAHVAAGADHVCVIQGTPPQVWCWGENGNGQLGDATTVDRATPTRVAPAG